MKIVIGVIGAGTMGAGIAQAFAQNQGYRVILCDISEELAERGKQRLAAGLKKRVEKGKLSPAECEAILDRIVTGTSSLCKDCDLIIEAAVESMEIKQETFKKLDQLCKPECIFTTNTSSLSITQIAQNIIHPVAGMHFFNPAPVMKLVEVIAGLNTPRKTVETVIRIAEDIGKVPVEVNESAGFVVNRLLIPMINEAIGIYAEGGVTKEGIDVAMKLGANHPMGPLALGDLVGLDVCLAIMEVLYQEFGDSKYRPHPYLRKMVRGGRLGIKTGCGFYDYGER